MAGMYCIIPHFLAYKVLKISNSVRIRFNQAEESKYEILIPLDYKSIPINGEILSCLQTQQPDPTNGK